MIFNSKEEFLKATSEQFTGGRKCDNIPIFEKFNYDYEEDYLITIYYPSLKNTIPENKDFIYCQNIHENFIFIIYTPEALKEYEPNWYSMWRQQKIKLIKEKIKK